MGVFGHHGVSGFPQTFYLVAFASIGDQFKINKNIWVSFLILQFFLHVIILPHRRVSFLLFPSLFLSHH